MIKRVINWMIFMVYAYPYSGQDARGADQKQAARTVPVLSSATMKVLVTLVALGILTTASAVQSRPTLIWVEAPGVRMETARLLSEDGALLWLGEAIERGELRPLAAIQVSEVDSLRARLRRLPTARVDVGWRSAPAAGHVILDLAGSLREAEAWIDEEGRPTSEFAAGWNGESGWEEIRRIAGIDEHLRWEEVEEFLCLSPRQNRAVRDLPTSLGHPIWRLRRAYSADKFFANAAIFYGRTSGAERVFLAAEIVRVYETELLPWSEKLLQTIRPHEGEDVDGPDARRRFFLRRVRSSSPRIYGRFDRLLQSLQATWGERAVVVVDASDSPDPFLAVRAPILWPQNGAVLDDLRDLLGRLGWVPQGAGPRKRG